MGDLNPYAQRLVSAATSDRGFRLTGTTRALMEHCFNADLQDIRLHYSESSGKANQAFGSVAFAVDRHICFGPEFDASKGSAFTYILAHEIAHVLQKRRAASPKPRIAGSCWQLELEADRSALQVLRGQPVSQLSADAWTGPRCWDVQGHYYTVLWASLAAGLSLPDAERNSFFTQMPDQVSELDAIAAGVSWGGEFGSSVYASLNAKGLKVLTYTSPVMAHYLTQNPWIVQYWNHAADQYIDEMVVEWQVQTGLHALTGRNADEETARRLGILDGLAKNSFEFGLALHPYGDSFAHRDLEYSATMYPPPMGHLIEKGIQMAHKQFSGSAHDPDNIRKRPWLYRQYGWALYDLFVRRWAIKKPPIDREKFGKELLEVSTDTDDPDMQTASIIGFAAVALNYSTDMKPDEALDVLNNLYRPEKAQKNCMGQFPQTWAEFYAENHLRPNIDLTPDLLKRALACAAKWTGSAKPAAVFLEY